MEKIILTDDELKEKLIDAIEVDGMYYQYNADKTQIRINCLSTLAPFEREGKDSFEILKERIALYNASVDKCNLMHKKTIEKNYKKDEETENRIKEFNEDFGNMYGNI